MKIIEGNYYRRRDGIVVGPMVRLNGGDFYWTIHTIYCHPCYTIGGFRSLTLADKHEWDLVECVSKELWVDIWH
jgi:hypothetical protein